MNIPLNKTKIIKNLSGFYINNSSKISNLYDNNYDLNSYENQIKKRKNFSQENRNILVSLLKENISEFNSKKTINNINLLSNKNTYTVTTGHQLCLNTGPLFFIYKIAECIKLSIELNKKYKEYNFIPIYWMASEDHDIYEIFDFEYNFEIKNKPDVKKFENRFSGNIKTLEIEKYLIEVEEKLFKKFNNSWDSIFIEIRKNSNNISEYIYNLISFLFSEYGIVCINPNKKEFKKIFLPYVIKDIQNSIIEKSYKETIKNIPKGIKPIVKPNKINYFFLEKNLRYKIEKKGEKYYIGKIQYNIKQLIDLFKKQPEKISPNVITRGLFQETILPNISYIGGGGEISYWLLFKNIFDKIEIPFPILKVRNSILHLTDKNYSVFEKVVNKEVFLNDFNYFIKDYLNKKYFEIYDNIKKQEEAIKQNNEIIKQILQKENILIEKSINSVETKILKQYRHLKDKTVREFKKKKDIEINRFKEIIKEIYHKDVFQERIINYTNIYSKKETKFVEILIDKINPFKNYLYIIKKT